MNLQTDVCIVGGGPAGILLGYLLASNGVSVVVLERSFLTERNFRGEHINYETEMLLKEYKLFEKIEELGLLRMERVEFFAGKQIVKTITPGPDEDHVGIHIPQSHLLDAIISKSQQYDNYQLYLNTSVTELIQDDREFFSGVSAIRNEEKMYVSCSVVIGADGRFSTIRKLANIPFAKRKHGYDILWAKVPAPKGWKPTTRMLHVKGHQLAIFTQTGGFIQIGWNIDEASFASLKKGSFIPFLTPLVETFPELREIALKHLQSWKDFVCLKVESSLCENWVMDGLVMIGDAAHTMTPTGAIGINCAMKDAHVLAPILLKALREKKVDAEYLRAFDERRRAEIIKQQEMQIEEEAMYAENFVHYARN
ncbi:MAG: FAD-dependent monooxygenase [Bacillota bacterium]|nr:FAD-dependent monooxygenase [Bacillota bacterium]